MFSHFSSSNLKIFISKFPIKYKFKTYLFVADIVCGSYGAVCVGFLLKLQQATLFFLPLNFPLTQ